MIDVNDLKFINDYFGHIKGDYIIKAAAEVLLSSVRDSDTVCRYGGDELVVLLPNTSEEEALIIHKRILENVSRWNEEDNKYPDIRLSLSIGCASAHGKEGLSDILTRADQKMYEDKRRYKMGIHEENPVERAKKQYYSY
jgi:diguanylate cyclase (GGDEF)-like protein